MLYAILLPLRRWVQWLRADNLHWLQTHTRLEPGYGQAAKDYRDMHQLAYELYEFTN